MKTIKAVKTLDAMHRALILPLLAVALLPAAAQAQPHQHGVASLDIAVEPARITLQLSTPLDSLVGFERAPRNDAERRRAAAAVETLKAGVFSVDPAAGCTPAGVTLASAALGLGEARPVEGEHADLDAEFRFDCRDAARAAFVETRLFAAFARMQRIDVQGATPRGQFKRTLRRPAARVELGR